MEESRIVTVPDLSATDLTALVKRELDLTSIEEYYERWDYYIDVKGQPITGRELKFQVRVWKPELKPNETILTGTVRKYFHDLGYVGHTGAFTQWRRTCGLQGFHASIPEEEACLHLSDGGGCCVPCSIFLDSDRVLGLAGARIDWHAYWSFLAFKPVT